VALGQRFATLSVAFGNRRHCQQLQSCTEEASHIQARNGTSQLSRRRDNKQSTFYDPLQNKFVWTLGCFSALGEAIF